MNTITVKDVRDYAVGCILDNQPFDLKEFDSMLYQLKGSHHQQTDTKQSAEIVPTLNEMILAASKITDIPFAAIIQSSHVLGSRKTDKVRARMLVCWYAKAHNLPYSLKQIGKALGGRDHTTIMSLANNGRQSVDIYSEFRTLYGMFCDEVEKTVISRTE